MEPAGNGYHAAEEAGILPGDNVVVIGPGPFGMLAMQCANTYHPGKLIMLGTRDSRLEMATRLGATHVVNIRTEDPVKAVMSITSGQGADRILNCATTDSSFEIAMKIAGKNSVIVMEGVSGSEKPIPILMDDFIVKTVAIKPACGVHTRQYMDTMALVQAKRVDVKSLITHRFPLEQMDEALRTMKEKRDEVMKILIFPNGEIKA